MVSTGKSTGYSGILAGITTGLVTVLIAALGQTPAVLAASAEKHIADQIIFGNAASDRTHHLVLHHAKFIVGGLHQTALRLQPLSPPQDDGGYATLTMRVDPNRRNYWWPRPGREFPQQARQSRRHWCLQSPGCGWRENRVHRVR